MDEINKSGQNPIPTSKSDDSFKIVSESAETIQLYYYNAGVLTADAGQAAGTVVIGKSAYAPIYDGLGTKIANKGNTSLSFTCLAFTNEIRFPTITYERGFDYTGTEFLTLITKNFSNGDYCVDYRTGTVYGKKATTASTMTSVAYKRPSSTTVIDAGDIQIGAVEIKDATSDNRASVDSTGALKVTGGASSVSAQYISPADFTASYTSSSTITLTGLPFTITNSSQIVYVKGYNTSTKIATTYVAGANGYSFGYSAGVITIYLAGVAITALTSNDTYEVGINTQNKSYDPTVDVTKTIDQSPLSAKYVQDSILDTTNIAAATNYYPSSTGMSMDGFSALSVSGKIIDADNTTTLTIEAMNDEDTASGDWIDVTKCFNDDNAGVATSIGASITVTSGTKTFAVSRAMFNYTYFRFKLVTADATNTVIIKTRRIY